MPTYRRQPQRYSQRQLLSFCSEALCFYSEAFSFESQALSFESQALSFESQVPFSFESQADAQGT